MRTVTIHQLKHPVLQRPELVSSWSFACRGCELHKVTPPWTNHMFTVTPHQVEPQVVETSQTLAHGYGLERGYNYVKYSRCQKKLAHVQTSSKDRTRRDCMPANTLHITSLALDRTDSALACADIDTGKSTQALKCCVLHRCVGPPSATISCLHNSIHPLEIEIRRASQTKTNEQ